MPQPHIMHYIVFPLALFFFLTSCAIHSGNLANSTSTDSVVHEDIAIGVSTSNHFLGLGGIKKDSLVFDARRSLYASRPLMDNERYGIMSIDVKRSFYILGYKTKITIAADVVRPRMDSSEAIYSATYIAKMNPSKSTESLFSIGDSICSAETNQYGVIQGFSNKKTERARVLFVDYNQNARIKTVSFSRLYVMKNIPNCKYTIGEKLNENTQVIGIGTNGILLFGPQGFAIHNLDIYKSE